MSATESSPRPIDPSEWRLSSGDGVASWHTLSTDARYALAQSRDAQRRARVHLLRAVERWLRDGYSAPRMARDLRVTVGTVRRLIDEVRAGLAGEVTS